VSPKRVPKGGRPQPGLLSLENAQLTRRLCAKRRAPQWV
jgi:hypothetical protein